MFLVSFLFMLLFSLSIFRCVALSMCMFSSLCASFLFTFLFRPSLCFCLSLLLIFNSFCSFLLCLLTVLYLLIFYISFFCMHFSLSNIYLGFLTFFPTPSTPPHTNLVFCFFKSFLFICFLFPYISISISYYLLSLIILSIFASFTLSFTFLFEYYFRVFYIASLFLFSYAFFFFFFFFFLLLPLFIVFPSARHVIHSRSLIFILFTFSFNLIKRLVYSRF
jgi:hypothetical protein